MGGLIFIAVIISWLWFCVWLARKVVSWIPIESGGLKGLIGLLTFAVLLPLPLIDEIIGKFQFDKLCREEAGVKVYGKLKLGAEFFNADGTPNFINPNTGHLSEEISPYIEFVWPPPQKIPSIAELTKMRVQVRDRGNGKILAENIAFGMYGGWLSFNHQSWLGTRCINGNERLDEILKRVITQN